MGLVQCIISIAYMGRATVSVIHWGQERGNLFSDGDESSTYEMPHRVPFPTYEPNESSASSILLGPTAVDTSAPTGHTKSGGNKDMVAVVSPSTPPEERKIGEVENIAEDPGVGSPSLTWRGLHISYTLMIWHLWCVQG